MAERRANNSAWSQSPVKSSASSELFLLLFEFEALSKLHDPRAESVLERALTLPHPEPKLFHTLAALAVDGQAKNAQLGMRALKVAIRLQLQADKPDFVKCSIDVRQLIALALNGREEEALTYFRETVDVIETRAQGEYPDTEVLWLMTKSWNHGLQYFNCGKTREAELWCSMSMKLLKYTISRASYEDQMVSVYGEMMTRLEQEQSDRGSRLEE
ncbi:testis-expressed protein 11 [Aplysia californica]|uniref:Testis-expressed protein 11 n=1 Tax=Aplysia californica TaxID=6500 RepID=A0ABM1AFI7_APLCA|nr:testis-expressed protein 11 [Aplysia californica]